MVKVHRGAELLQAPLIEHSDAVPHGHGFHLVMGDVDRCRAQLPLQIDDAGSGAVAQLGIQVAERFIHQKHRRLARHGPTQGDPLLLPAGELLGQTVQQWFQFQSLGDRLNTLLNQVLSWRSHPEEGGKSTTELSELILKLLGQAAMAAAPQAETEVVPHAEMGVERVALEDHGHIAATRPHLAHGPLADDNFACRGAFQARQQPQQGAFPTTRPG